MRIHGKITHWNRQKAYGFITPESGDNVFVHINAFENRDHKPAIGQSVTYTMSTDKQGRACAADVTLQGETSASTSGFNPKILYIVGAIAVLAVVVWLLI